jgi:hypothetical protein
MAQDWRLAFMNNAIEVKICSLESNTIWFNELMHIRFTRFLLLFQLH